MDNDIVIAVNDVSKRFLLPHERAHTLKSIFTGALKGKKNKTIEKQQALGNISFNVKKGEFFGIVGRNGSGKSTLLKILAEIYQPTSGSVAIEGRLIPFIELGVGFNAELTGRENVFLSASLMGFSKKEIEALYQDIVDFAELEEFMDQKLKNYSSGMQVRLAFSIATRAQGDILLVDEVLAVGDADFQRKCFDYFRKLKKDKKTVVFVSHDMDAVRQYCDRAIMVEKSRLIAQGDPESVSQEYTKLFMNDRQYQIAEQGARRGSGKLKYSSVSISPNTLKDSDKTVEFKVKIKAQEDTEEPIAGFAVTNAAGQKILGINTRIKNLRLGAMKKGEEIELEWSVPNIFNDGNYELGVALVEPNGITEHDIWDGAGVFTAYRNERTPYPVAPKISVKKVSHRKNG